MINVKVLQPHQLGWLHKVELDHDNIQVWEKPDGKLYAHDKRQGQLLLNFWKMKPNKDNPAAV